MHHLGGVLVWSKLGYTSSLFEEGRARGREVGREVGREGGREGGRKEGRGGREGGREGGRKEGREGIKGMCIIIANVDSKCCFQQHCAQFLCV